MKKLFIALMLIGLVGCSTAENAAVRTAIATGVEAKKNFNDNKARLSILAVCDMTIGAYYRLAVIEQYAVAAVCGGQPLPILQPPLVEKGIK